MKDIETVLDRIQETGEPARAAVMSVPADIAKDLDDPGGFRIRLAMYYDASMAAAERIRDLGGCFKFWPPAGIVSVPCTKDGVIMPLAEAGELSFR